MKKSIKRGQEDKQPNLAVITSTEDIVNEIFCYYCGSQEYWRRGIKHGQQTFSCKACGKCFSQKPNQKLLDKLARGSIIITGDELGLAVPKYLGYSGGLDVGKIRQTWLRESFVRFLYYIASRSYKWATLRNYLNDITTFSDFLVTQYPQVTDFSELNRQLIIDYLLYLNERGNSPGVRKYKISSLRVFLSEGVSNEWFDVPAHLIRSEDYPKRAKPLPRYIPEEVISQLLENLDQLPEVVARMVLVLLECGFRISEACQLPINCLQQDARGDWSIKYTNWKMNRETIKPISQELASVIQKQHKYIKEALGNNFQYLFCGSRRGRNEKWAGGFVPEPKVLLINTLLYYLKKLARDCVIKDSSGSIWNFQSHQFRHTAGTRMINMGVPQHIVQKFLDHDSPEMTMVYAHIHDETLRKEIDKYHESRVVNFQCETVELESTVLASNDDLEWFKKNVLAMALPHGYCGRPKLLGFCNLPTESCYDCPHWRTNKNFLPVLKDTLERTNSIINKARNCGWELQVAKNQPIKDNLDKVIESLEEDK